MKIEEDIDHIIDFKRYINSNLFPYIMYILYIFHKDRTETES